MESTPLSVSDAVALINQTLEYAYPTIAVEGEIGSFKINQNKYVFFDLKDTMATLGCFMMVYALRQPLEDGMKVRVIAQPKLTAWGKFSLTVRDVQPIGEGSLKRAFELLHEKLTKEGLFDPARKRMLPHMPRRVGVVSSTQAAGYGDFVKILNNRWGGMEVIVAHTAVQGASASRQIVRAVDYLNELPEPLDVIAIVRGGGSADDLSSFNDEALVRAVARSRVPTITGIGHEVDTSLCDLAADVRASTPSNAAEILVPDRRETAASVDVSVSQIDRLMQRRIASERSEIERRLSRAYEYIQGRFAALAQRYKIAEDMLRYVNPQAALQRGYCLLRDESGRVVWDVNAGSTVSIETKTSMIKAGVINVERKK